jgi:iron complex outermembrane receptor protein
MLHRLAVALAGFLASTALVFAQSSNRHHFDIPVEDLGKALTLLGQQAEREVVFPAEITRGKRSVAVSGDLTLKEALDKLLAGSGLTYHFGATGPVVIEISKGPIGEGGPSPPSGGADSAQGSKGAQLEDIIVTAQKRSENVQDVPSSITVVSGEQLANANVSSIKELSTVVPAFTDYSGAYGEARSTFSLRGIGTVSNGQLVQPSVGVVLDGVVLARSGSSVFNFDDVDRIEVLRGPQGTLFGKNTSAGAINIATNDPTETFLGKLGVSYGTYNEVRMHGTDSGPLIDNTLLAGVSFFVDNRDGYIRNIFDGRDYNGSDQRGVRAKFLYTPFEGTRIKVIVDASDATSSCCATPIWAVNAQSDLAEQGLYPGFAYPSGFVNPTNDKVDMQGVSAQDISRGRGLSVQLDQAIGDFTLTSISAYRTWYGTWDIPFNPTPISEVPPSTNTMGTGNQYQVSEELRVASPKRGLVDYVAGLFIYKDRIYQTEHYVIDLAPFVGPPIGNLTSGGDWASHGGSDNYAAFGEANIHLNDSLTVIAGARETHETVHLDLHGLYIGGALMDVNHASDTVNDLSWRLGARWKVDSDNMVYATVSRGFKGPAYDDKTLGSGVPVKPEVATSYELGWKSELLDRRIRADLALFLTNLDEFQAQAVIFIPGTTQLQELLVNAGKLRNQGVELEIDAVPLEHLTVNFGGAYINSKFISFPDAPCYGFPQQTAAQGCTSQNTQTLAGRPNALVPKVSFNTGINYDVILSSRSIDAFVRADYSWRSQIQWDILQSPLSLEGSVGQLGGAFGIKSKDGRLTLTAYGRNLTNRFYTAGIEEGGDHYLPPDYKRTVGVGLDYKY